MKPDIRIIGLNETDQFNIAEENISYIKSVYSVYMYDANEQTYCCELQSSYYLIHLYDYVEFNDNTPQDKQDELSDFYTTENNDDLLYGGTNQYVHCHTIDRLIKQKLCKVYCWDKSEDCIPSDYEYMMEDLREYFSCNHQI